MPGIPAAKHPVGDRRRWRVTAHSDKVCNCWHWQQMELLNHVEHYGCCPVWVETIAECMEEREEE